MANPKVAPKVAVVVPWDKTGDSYKYMEAAGCHVSIADASWASGFHATRESYVALCQGADAIIGARLEGFPITGDLLAEIPHLRIYCRYNIGYDDIDIHAATKCGVIVTNSPVESNWGAVAENTFAFMLALLKNLKARDAHVKEGGWRDMKLAGTYIGPRLDGYAGITLGIIGLGRIGGRLADLFQPWRIKILACDPYVDESKFVHHNATPVDMETLLRESDVVTTHCNLTKETTNLIGAKELGQMKSSAILVNAARGPIVDVDALFDALEADQIAGAALDVLAEEPPADDHPLIGREDVILTPHLGASSHEAQENVASQVAEQISTFFIDGVAHNAINAPAVSAETLRQIAPYVLLAEKLGGFLRQRSELPVRKLEITVSGETKGAAAEYLSLATLVGLFTAAM